MTDTPAVPALPERHDVLCPHCGTWLAIVETLDGETYLRIGPTRFTHATILCVCGCDFHWHAPVTEGSVPRFVRQLRADHRRTGQALDELAKWIQDGKRKNTRLTDGENPSE